jgi:hypothetical protein
VRAIATGWALAAAFGAAALGVPLAGCSTNPSGTIQIVTGEEDASTTFAGVTSVDVTWVGADAAVHPLAQVTWPAKSIDLGSIDELTVGQLQVTGHDATDASVVFGSVIPLQFGALDGVTVPVFVQRVGGFARLPAPTASDSRTAPYLGLLGGRYVFVAGGDGGAVTDAGTVGTQLYDLLTLQSLPSPPSLPAAESTAVVGTVVYMVTENGVDTYDLSDSEGGTLTLPSSSIMNYSAASIAGGTTITALDGTQYIIGGTRTTHDPTAAVLRIDTTGDAGWISLNHPRLGASAVWIDGLGGGIAVAGGTPAGSDAGASGLEFIAAGPASNVADVLYPTDMSIGAGAATLDDEHLVVLAGGTMPDMSDPGVRVLDLECDGGCIVQKPLAQLPIPLVSAQAFGMPGQESAVVVGSEVATGLTHAFLLTGDAGTEIPTRVPHTLARAMASPVGITPGSFLLFGGAPEIESYAPPF